MILSKLFLLVVSLYSASVVALDYDGTRIANRTIERTVQLRTHSLFAPYIDQDLQNRWWDFGADAYVNTNKHIRLTRNRQSLTVQISPFLLSILPAPNCILQGWLWSRLPLTAFNFIIEVEFKITGSTTHLYGDGLALWITAERAEVGPVFGSKDYFTGIGIFLDTYKNDLESDYPFPRVIAMKGDGKTSYDLAKDGVPNMVGECAANYRRSNVATKLRVTYVKDTVLDVKIQWKGWEEWSDCFMLRDISLPSNPYIGLSAMTGDVSDAHDVISVSTSSAILSAAEAPRDKLQAVGSGVGWFSSFFRFILFAAALAGVWFGWKTYGRRYFPRAGGHSAFGRGGGGLMWSDGKRF
ncbi:concanavalin A-like lectin/glucanase domain-containing protein [Multifurca ochricompacta]|uniref:Concanavalin A-like lectin/glucanase domain-containing protein n=1 Tax=Multifurca ochricompacta TaxID=376703 RepID=A0AAD4M3B3_9AGAM|nr:concanavalin A-like lectin/glucanase domain-containing protein [Multifurca ochricompacta]